MVNERNENHRLLVHGNEDGVADAFPSETREPLADLQIGQLVVQQLKRMVFENLN